MTTERYIKEETTEKNCTSVAVNNLDGRKKIYLNGNIVVKTEGF